MKKITLYAKFNYSECDEDLVLTLEEYLNSQAEAIYHFFDNSLSRDLVEINIVSTKREYDKIVCERKGVKCIPKWEIGNSHENIIEYVSLHDYKNTSHGFSLDKYSEYLEYYKRTIIHEFVHYVVNLYCKKHNIDFPLKYLNEGIAQYLSGQRKDTNLTFEYSLDDILNSRNCYLGWYLLTKFIIKNYDRDYFFKLFGNREFAIIETPRLYSEAKEYYDKNYNEN